MKDDTLEILRCPIDKAELDIEVDSREDDEIIAGTLICQECGEEYPIEDGIANLLPPEMRDDAPA